MTTFILHGGFNPEGRQEDDRFFSEIIKNAPAVSNILLVYFAKETDRIAANSTEDISQFEKNKGDKTLKFSIATQEHFIDQLETADVVYFHGGVSLKLLSALKEYPDFRLSLNNKVIAGDFAGANVFLSRFYSLKSERISNGLGYISADIVCHYSDQYKHIFEDNSSGREVIWLREYETKVMRIEL